MKVSLLLAVILGATLAQYEVGTIVELNTWQGYKRRFGKFYPDSEEDTFRRILWEKSSRVINRHNELAAKGIFTFAMDFNTLSDMTDKEAEVLLGTRVPAEVSAIKSNVGSTLAAMPLPSSFNYTNSPCLSQVKNQGTCGSCWAFGATTPLEFLACNRTTPPTPTVLSESQLMNCSSGFGNYGCNGGWYPNAWNYIIMAPGQASASSLPYYPKTGACGYNSSYMKVAEVASYEQIPNDATQIIESLITKGPLAAAMKVLSKSFNPYRSGVYSDPECPNTCLGSDVNHAVVLVGYGNDATTGLDYWLVRNSWGSNWGDNGYFKIQRGVNMCNIECFTYFVTV